MSTRMLHQERRTDPRYHIDWPISLLSDSQGRTYNGRGQNLSRGGALVVLPLSAPLCLGQQVRMRLHPILKGTHRPSGSRAAEVRPAKVVRVQREPRFLDGLQLVGLKFLEPSSPTRAPRGDV